MIDAREFHDLRDRDDQPAVLVLRRSIAATVFRQCPTQTDPIRTTRSNSPLGGSVEPDDRRHAAAFSRSAARATPAHDTGRRLVATWATRFVIEQRVKLFEDRSHLD